MTKRCLKERGCTSWSTHSLVLKDIFSGHGKEVCSTLHVVFDIQVLHFYRPQTKLRKGNVFTGVCDSVHRGGVPGPEGVWSWGVPAPGGHLLLGRGCLVWGGGAWSEGVPSGDPPGTATAVGGTHPTGMHSCVCRKLINNFLLIFLSWNLYYRSPYLVLIKQT